MSNTTISPSVAGLTAAGVALAMGLAIAPVQSEAAIAGIGATTTAASSAAPAFNGMPVSWALKAGGAGPAVGPLAFRQVRLTASGTWGSFGSALIQVSPDNVNWTTLAAISDPVSPGAVVGEAPGLCVTPIAGGVVVSVTDATANSIRYLRPVAQNGDAQTAINVTGNVSITGAV